MISISCKTTIHDIININKQTSLNLLKVKALKADFSVEILVFQKLINKNEVKPINSQPKKIIIKLPDVTKIDILITNKFIKIIKRSILGSYLK